MVELDPTNYGNDQALEMSWAIAAYDHAEVHYNILSAVPDAKILQLTPCDGLIYKEFCEKFPRFKVDCFVEDDIKSEDQKKLWRDFCNQFDGIVEDFNRGTLLRLDCSKGYDESNTCIVPRVQFLAIEIARNRLGFNDCVSKLNHKQ